jgi:microcystin-dependent protein
MSTAGGVLRGNVGPVGSYIDFAAYPGSTVLARGGIGTGTEPYVECDGSVYFSATFPDLAALLTNTYGGNGTTTFGVPNLTDTGRYRRSRTAFLGVSLTQSNTVGPHAHTASTSTTTSTTTSTSTSTTVTVNAAATGISAATNSSYIIDGGTTLAGSGPQGVHFGNAAGNGVTISDPTHTHTAGATSSSSSSSSSVSTSTTTVDANTGTTETRPESIVVITALKT